MKFLNTDLCSAKGATELASRVIPKCNLKFNVRIACKEIGVPLLTVSAITFNSPGTLGKIIFFNRKIRRDCRRLITISE